MKIFSDTSSTNTKTICNGPLSFKEDVEGYLDDRKTHLYLLDIETEDVDTLTSGNYI